MESGAEEAEGEEGEEGGVGGKNAHFYADCRRRAFVRYPSPFFDMCAHVCECVCVFVYLHLNHSFVRNQIKSHNRILFYI